jgi:mono/diheme cytochrome c family protein
MIGAIPSSRDGVAPLQRIFALVVTLASGVWLAVLAASVQAPASRPQATARRVDFQQQIQPILAKRCLECHSADKRKGGLSLASYADALEGGRNGAAIRPGNSTSSLLIHRLSGDVEPQMPKDEDPLSSSELALVRAWIDQGARETA